MKLTDNDMDRVDFWPTWYDAENVIRTAVKNVGKTDDDKVAKAMADAVEVLCKAMLLARDRANA